jgi:hypothetical protein
MKFLTAGFKKQPRLNVTSAQSQSSIFAIGSGLAAYLLPGVKAMPRNASFALCACAIVVTAEFAPVSTICTTRLELMQPL